MSKAAESLTAIGTPNNILTRTVWRVLYTSIRFPAYYGITITSIVTGRDRLEILQAVADKLKLDIDVTDTK